MISYDSYVYSFTMPDMSSFEDTTQLGVPSSPFCRNARQIRWSRNGLAPTWTRSWAEIQRCSWINLRPGSMWPVGSAPRTGKLGMILEWIAVHGHDVQGMSWYTYILCIWYDIILYILYYIILYYIILYYYSILLYIILYYTILYYII